MRRLLLFPALVVLTSVSSPPAPYLTGYVPIMMSRDELNKSITLLPAQPFRTTGKIYKFNNTLFAIEPYKGVHVFDNTDPAAPVNSGFIRIPGCVDVAVKDGKLYADNAVDLVTIDISQANQPRLVNRQMNVFPEMLPPDRLDMPGAYAKDKRPADLVIVGWKSKTIGE
ncbi:MAG: hypothetical protein V4616_03775 [Bacteroidota bacterium]